MYSYCNDFLIFYGKNNPKFQEKKLPFSKWDNFLQLTFEGECIIDGIVYSHQSNHSLPIFESIGSFENGLSGEYSYVFVNNDKLYAGTDPLGAKTLFYINEDFFCLSNSFELIYSFCKNIIEFNFNPYPFLNSMFVGFSFYPTTSIDKIKILNINEYIVIDRSVQSINIINTTYWDFIEDVASHKISYEDILSKTVDVLKDHTEQCINKAYAENRKLTLELTAGKDSRLVLASLLSLGFTDFYLRTYGSADSKDFCFSSLIATLFNLNYVTYKQDIPLLQGVKQHCSKSAGVYRLIDACYASSGIHDNLSIMSGCYGELCRGYYDKQLFKKMDCNIGSFSSMNPYDKFINLFNVFALRNFLTSEHKHYIANECTAFYKEFFSKTLNYVCDHIFAFCRSRFHFGQTLHFRNRFFYPTYAIANINLFHALSFAVSFEQRVGDINMHKLIEKLYSPLCYFEHESKPLFYAKNYGNTKKFELIKIPKKAFPCTCSKSVNENYVNDYSELEKIFQDMAHDEIFSGLLNQEQIIRFSKSTHKESHLKTFSGLLFFYDKFVRTK